MSDSPTVLDVARVAGVSRQTVSNVLNAPSLVREETRVRVESAIRDLGYQPHASARRLRTRRSSTIGVRIDETRDGISGAVLDRFLHRLTVAADDRGFRIMLFPATDAEDEIAHIRRLSDGVDADAFVLTSTEHGDTRVAWMTANSVPFVTFGRPWGAEDIYAHPWVDVDGRAGTATATRHFVSRGARRIGFLGWPPPSGTGDDRRRGWADVVAAHNLPMDRGLTAASRDDVAEAEGVVRHWLDSGAELDALVCASDSLALGATLAFGRVGRRDIPISGFDNTPVAAAVGLTSVEQRTDLVAEAVVDLLLDPRGGISPAGGEHPHRLVRPELIVREGRRP